MIENVICAILLRSSSNRSPPSLSRESETLRVHWSEISRVRKNKGEIRGTRRRDLFRTKEKWRGSAPAFSSTAQRQRERARRRKCGFNFRGVCFFSLLSFSIFTAGFDLNTPVDDRTLRTRPRCNSPPPSPPSCFLSSFRPRSLSSSLENSAPSPRRSR